MSLLWKTAKFDENGKWSEDDEDWRSAKPNKYGKKPAELYGNVNHPDEYFQGASSRPVPWPQQDRRKDVKDYDNESVKKVLQKPPVLEDVDPRHLKASQPSIVRAALTHYQDAKPGDDETFADKGNAGNRHPVVYEHENGDQVILSGHHRAAKALFAGHPLRARIVRGGRPPR